MSKGGVSGCVREGEEVTKSVCALVSVCNCLFGRVYVCVCVHLMVREREIKRVGYFQSHSAVNVYLRNP